MARRARHRRLHRRLAWTAGFALIVWGLSGILHVFLTLTGPPQVRFHGPAGALDLAGAKPIADLLESAGLGEVRAVQVITVEHEPLLQVTERGAAARRYFGLADGAERFGHDQAYAVYLARHYLGPEAGDLRSATLQTGFDGRYRPINRLLPVWRVEFAGGGRVTAWVCTETGALALASNTVKERLQQAFALAHTWDWLPAELNWLRVVVVGALVSTILATVVLGFRMRILAGTGTGTGRRTPARTWHRRTAWLLAVPVFMLAASGLYHLVHATARGAGQAPGPAPAMNPAINPDRATFPLFERWTEVTEGLDVARVSLLGLPDGTLLYRLGLRPDGSNPAPEGSHAIRNARFDGVPRTGPAVYLSAASGEPWPDGDREVALRLAESFTGMPRTAMTSAALVTRFGPVYDFRNKRVPVWRIDYGAPLDTSYFIDTVTGVLADARSQADRWEAFSFSYLHKWSFLMPAGRAAQNALVVGVVLLAVLALAGFGLRLRWPARRAGPARNPAARMSRSHPGGRKDIQSRLYQSHLEQTKPRENITLGSGTELVNPMSGTNADHMRRRNS